MLLLGIFHPQPLQGFPPTILLKRLKGSIYMKRQTAPGTFEAFSKDTQSPQKEKGEHSFTQISFPVFALWQEQKISERESQ